MPPWWCASAVQPFQYSVIGSDRTSLLPCCHSQWRWSLHHCCWRNSHQSMQKFQKSFCCSICQGSCNPSRSVLWSPRTTKSSNPRKSAMLSTWSLRFGRNHTTNHLPERWPRFVHHIIITKWKISHGRGVPPMVIPGVTTRQSRVHKKPVALTLLLMKEILHQFVVYPNLTRCLYILGGLC